MPKTTLTFEVPAILHADGRVEPYKDADPREGYTLKELQAVVGGSIEIVRLSDEVILVVHDEGRILDMPVNHYASLMYRQFRGGDIICGPALVCRSRDVK